MRADAESLMPDSAVIKRRSNNTTDDYGFPSGDPVAVGTVVARLDPQKQSDAKGVYGEREASRNYFMLSVPWNADLQNGDTVTINSATMEVVELHEIHSGRVAIRATVARLGDA